MRQAYLDSICLDVQNESPSPVLWLILWAQTKLFVVIAFLVLFGVMFVHDPTHYVPYVMLFCLPLLCFFSYYLYRDLLRSYAALPKPQPFTSDGVSNTSGDDDASKLI